MSTEIVANRRRAALLVALEVAVVTLLLAVVLWLLLGWWSLLVSVVVVGALAFAATRQATRTVLRRVGAAPADPERHARYHNLVENLCVSAGLPKPQLFVLDDPAPNALACGRSPRTAAVVVTQGLLDLLNRIELEGVLAHELSHVRRLDILPATYAAVFAAPFGPRAVAFAVAPEREAAADTYGVRITRYPPGLLSALEKIEADTHPFSPRSRTIAHLWLRGPETGVMGRRPFEERIEALREL